MAVRDALPEGDTLHQAATRVRRAIGGDTIRRVDGTHRAVKRDGRRLVGATADEIVAVGKHLIVQTSSGWSLRTHLGMTGKWRTYVPGEPWRITPGKARAVITTDAAVAVCFAAPTVEVAPTEIVMAGLQRLGPDLALSEPDYDEVLRRVRERRPPTLADLLLDQTVAAGLGNVYKNEVLFLERRDPAAAPGSLDDEELLNLFRRGNRLLLANLTDARRTTTGNRGRERSWVYGRGGKPCRRCGAAIRSTTHGPLDRITYWCPVCQTS